MINKISPFCWTAFSIKDRLTAFWHSFQQTIQKFVVNSIPSLQYPLSKSISNLCFGIACDLGNLCRREVAIVVEGFNTLSLVLS